MGAAITTEYSEHLFQCRACLGLCRHCLDITRSGEACHETLPDIILALEVATILIENRSDAALDRLRFCAEACAFSATNWGHYEHPVTRQCAGACRQFYRYWCERSDS